jgi:nicotinamide-nucleotide amidase
VRDLAYLEALKVRFAKYLRQMAKTNEKQADLIEGASFLKNPRGTAPGQWVEKDGKVLVLLPGPPVEMKPMFDEDVLPRVRERAGNRLLRRRILKIAAMSESDVDQALAPLYRTFQNPRTTILSAPGQVELHLTAEGASEAEAEGRLEELAAGMRALLPGRFYTEDERELPEVVGALLRERSLRLALAESCTGGLLGARLTDVPGASLFFERSFVTYSNRSKVEELGVDAGLLERQGAVSEEVAAAMAAGARRVAGVEIGVGITGIAGPDGATEDKPVGLVFVAQDGAAGTRVRRALFPGNRERIRYQATQAALEMLRRGLLGLSPLV